MQQRGLASFKLVMSGYYLPATAQIRDLFETGQLLDFLGTDASLIAMYWREADDRKAREQFRAKEMCGPCSTKRDGFQQGQRATRYRADEHLWDAPPSQSHAATSAPQVAQLTQPAPSSTTVNS